MNIARCEGSRGAEISQVEAEGSDRDEGVLAYAEVWASTDNE